MATGAAVSVLAACAALVQPRAWRALDAGRLTAPAGITIGLAVTAAGLAAAMLPGLVGVLLAAVGIGVGTGLTTPLAFASLAAATPANRLGQTMGAAELGRELGDADGPLPVAGIAVAATLTAGYAALAAILAAAPLVLWLTVGPWAGLGGPGIRRGVVAVRCPAWAAEQSLEGQQDHASHGHPDTSSGQDVQGIVDP